MPGQWEFEQAARSLRAVRDRIDGARTVLDGARTAPSVSGGTVADVVQAALDVSASNARDVVTRLSDLASLCDRRAAVCADHAAALLQWQRRTDRWDEAARLHRLDPTAPDPGRAPPRPVAPFSWVEPR